MKGEEELSLCSSAQGAAGAAKESLTHRTFADLYSIFRKPGALIPCCCTPAELQYHTGVILGGTSRGRAFQTPIPSPHGNNSGRAIWNLLLEAIYFPQQGRNSHKLLCVELGNEYLLQRAEDEREGSCVFSQHITPGIPLERTQLLKPLFIRRASLFKYSLPLLICSSLGW